MTFSVFHPNFLDHLKTGGVVDGITLTGEDWFCEGVFKTFADIAEQKGCYVQPSKRRLKEARALWMNDIGNMKISGGGEPDHFKHAGFLAYWLRRRLVISLTKELPDAKNVDETLRKDFMTRPNELCSFLIGFRICLFFEAAKRTGSVREEYLRSIELTPEFVNDATVLFYEKQLSPHAMYLIYRSLFYRLVVSDRENVVQLRSVK